MPCYYPLTAWQGATGSPPVFKPRYGFTKLQLPCGQCIGCRLEYSRQWAMRCMHESQLHEENCFITLTYADEHLPPNHSLVKSDFQRFMKRLRKFIEPRRVRFFMCGEYGEQFARPHYHACLFGYDFSDKELFSERAGVRLFRSSILESLWPYGHCTVGTVTFESAAYVARYCLKKVVGDGSIEHYSRLDGETGEIFSVLPEYSDMSRRPGIASGWFDKFKSDLSKDFLTVRGVKVRPARFYDRLSKSDNEEVFNERKLKRVAAILDTLPGAKHFNPNARTRRRLEVMKQVKLNRISSLKRGLDYVI